MNSSLCILFHFSDSTPFCILPFPPTYISVATTAREFFTSGSSQSVGVFPPKCQGYNNYSSRIYEQEEE